MTILDWVGIGLYAIIALSVGVGLVMRGNTHDDCPPWWVIVLASLLWFITIPFLVGVGS